MLLSDSICKDFKDTGRSTESYIVFYQGGLIYHWTYVPGPVSQSSAKSEYYVACTAIMDLSNFRVINNELLNKDPYVVP